MYRLYFTTDNIQSKTEYFAIIDWLKENVSPTESTVEDLLQNILNESNLRLWQAEPPPDWIYHNETKFLFRFSQFNDLFHCKLRWS